MEGKASNHCQSCGKEIQDDFKVCPYCGKKITKKVRAKNTAAGAHTSSKKLAGLTSTLGRFYKFAGRALRIIELRLFDGLKIAA